MYSHLRHAGVGEALVDVPLATGTHEAGAALALIAPDLVHAGAAVVARPLEAVVQVLLAEETIRPVGAGAAEVVDHIVTDAAILARVRVAVVNVELAVLPL